jgi:hypothetical protein
MAQHSSEARRLRRDLDRELAAVSAETGEPMAWNAVELQIIGAIVDAIDRKVALEADLAAADDAKARVALSGEIRLTEGHVERLLRRIKTELPQPESKRTQKARAAANVRWNRSVS